MKDSLGDRMKSYEKDYRTVVPRNQPIIIRCDGKAFHTYTKGCEKPFDNSLIDAINQCAISLCKEIQGAQLAYVQSDEISLLIHWYKKYTSTAWFDRQVQKCVSVAASICSAVMTVESEKVFGQIRPAKFDARIFALPTWDVSNYFLWRQNDCTRNSIQMMARSLYSHKQCNNKNNNQLQEMIHQRKDENGNPLNWNNIPTHLKRGRCIKREAFITTMDINGSTMGITRSRWVVDNEIPIFSQNREYIEQYLEREEN